MFTITIEIDTDSDTLREAVVLVIESALDLTHVEYSVSSRPTS